MITRAVLAFVILTLGGLNALLAGSVETCTGNAADSLFGFVITLPLNMLGMALLGWRVPRIAVVIAAALPTVLALRYTLLAIELASGTPACTIITGDTHWEPGGDESTFALGWGAATLVFWIGLAVALVGGYRGPHDRHDEPSD